MPGMVSTATHEPGQLHSYIGPLGLPSSVMRMARGERAWMERVCVCGGEIGVLGSMPW